MSQKKILVHHWMLRYLYLEIKTYLHLASFCCCGLRNLRRLVRDVDAF